MLLKPLGEITQSQEYNSRTRSYYYEYMFSSPPTNKEWLRFEEVYAPRVLAFHLSEAQNYSALLDVLCRIRSSKPILPNLRSLHCRELKLNGLQEPALIFAHEGIREFMLIDSNSYSVSTCTFFDAMHTRIPHLAKLIIDINNDSQYTPPMIEMIRSFSGLRSLTLPAFTAMHQLMQDISALPRLKELNIISAPGQPSIGSLVSSGNRAKKRGKESQPALVDKECFLSLETLRISCSYAKAAAFLRHWTFFYSLSSIQIITPEQGHPYIMERLLTDIYAACPRIAHISLKIKPGTIDTSQAIALAVVPENVLTIQNLRPILQCLTIATFELVHSLPLYLGQEDMQEIASAWPHLKSVNLGCAPLTLKQSTSKRLGLSALLPFARFCPDIEELGLLIDAKSDVPCDAEIEEIPSPFRRLRVLSVGISEIDHEGVIAECLSFLCPSGCEIRYGADWYESDESSSDTKKWKTVSELLPRLLSVRARDEKRIMALQKRLQQQIASLEQKITLSENAKDQAIQTDGI
ncbi:hypothetical protein VKT23_014572 [Stygiomarasmius scandens]|uniref:F-box domain-containing protein n=1 Tax=Marasmiellus scandens TaxID=2682957 RepID=A0ABR1J093_9AGAR